MADGLPGTPAGPAGGPTPPAPAGVTQPPPTGASPATMPVANRGEQAAGMAHLAVAVHVLEQALPLLGMGSEAGKDVHSVLSKLSKHSGMVSPGVENGVLQKLMLANRQNAMNVSSMRGGTPPSAAPGGAPGGAMPPVPTAPRPPMPAVA